MRPSYTTKEERKAGLIVLCAVIAIWIVVLTVLHTYRMYSCHSKWEDSAMQVKYGPINGCMVKVDDYWLPELAVKVEPFPKGE